MSSRRLGTLVLAQFLSAFSDNAILFIVVAIVLQSGRAGSWYVPALQAVFLLAFVTLAPWVGSCAERFVKSRVLAVANLLKAAGATAILLHVEPLAGYAIVGVGAALHSPAKYGILPEVVPPEWLVRANGWVEGTTILAILCGTILGARIADISIAAALCLTIASYVAAAAVAAQLPPGEHRRDISLRRSWKDLRIRASRLLHLPTTRSALTDLSIFWASAATLRILLIAWAPAVLGLDTAAEVAELTLYLALGIVLGSGMAPRLIPLEKTRRTRYVGATLGLLFLGLAQMQSLWPARLALAGIGIAGGLFVVPLNAKMQQIGHQTIGSGAAVAIQNSIQNLAMLAAVGCYTLALSLGVGTTAVLSIIGMISLLATLVRPPPTTRN